MRQGGGRDGPIHCSHLSCDRAVCCDCATELEWELETCREHAYSVFSDLRDMYRNALRRAQMAERRAAYAEGRMVQSQLGGDQAMYSPTDGRRMYLPPHLAEKITRMGIRAREASAS